MSGRRTASAASSSRLPLKRFSPQGTHQTSPPPPPPHGSRDAPPVPPAPRASSPPSPPSPCEQASLRDRRDVMIDIETLGVAYGSVIVSIGAIEFDLSEPQRRFSPGEREQLYVVVDRESCESLGLTVEPETERWWASQSAGAREALTQPGVPLREALDRLRAFVQRPGTATVVWSYGAEFDFGHLRHCYEMLSMPVPWDYRNIMCCRTVTNLAYGYRHPPSSPGAAHNALHDCIVQVRALLAAVDYVKRCGGLRWRGGFCPQPMSRVDRPTSSSEKI